MIKNLAFGWTIYISYFTIDPKTGKRRSKLKTTRKQLSSKVACENFLRSYDIMEREIFGYTILDGFMGLDNYIPS
ncbi:unnamed protein product [marine sediment metagenome]|uniref:Uncharacterized protein n=1 Tax=marine sediment metagenome TaxID=412755 RepID=X1EVZ1_9ZZZZ